MILHGTEPRFSLEGQWDVEHDNSPSVPDRMRQFGQHIHEMREEVTENIERAKQYRKERYDEKIKQSRYRVGDLVWQYKPVLQKGISKKLAKKWHGLFRILRFKTQNTVVLQWVASGKIMQGAVHVDRLKIGHSKWSQPQQQLRLPPHARQINPDTDELELTEEETRPIVKKPERPRTYYPLPGEGYITTKTEKGTDESSSDRSMEPGLQLEPGDLRPIKRRIQSRRWDDAGWSVPPHYSPTEEEMEVTPPGKKITSKVPTVLSKINQQQKQVKYSPSLTVGGQSQNPSVAGGRIPASSRNFGTYGEHERYRTWKADRLDRNPC